MKKPKPSPTELAERAAKQLAKDRAIVAHLDGHKLSPIPAAERDNLLNGTWKGSEFSVQVVQDDPEPPLVAPRAVQLPPKRSDGWGKPVIIEVKALREEKR